RISGQMLEAALAAGICSAGGKAILLGVIPTPAVAYLARLIGAQAGVVISASHNVFSDNGIKFFGGDGYKLLDSVEAELEELLLGGLEKLEKPTGAKVGTIEYRTDLAEEYIKYALSTVQGDFKGMKIVVDCANGSSYAVTPEVLRRLGAEVIVLHNEPNGININDNCGSVHLESLQAAVKEHGADMGIAHDGDADRCLTVDENGEVVDGDHMMAICALKLQREGKLADDTLVATVMSNIGLHQAMKKAGIRIEVTAVGDRYVLENMRANGYVLGGEQSGHIIFSDVATTGDGLVTALQIVQAVAQSGKKLSELSACMVTFPQLLVNVRVKSKAGWETNEAILAAIREGEAELGDAGRILVRPSGTEPLIRVMAEGPTAEVLDTIVGKIADVVRKEQGQD
ncbi:MAG: phosphoglucosamine mutase, partial [Selenomonadales bacterium]|nr:phosphoglucosamine mutase [Selenomonadales bacterium]